MSPYATRSSDRARSTGSPKLPRLSPGPNVSGDAVEDSSITAAMKSARRTIIKAAKRFTGAGGPGENSSAREEDHAAKHETATHQDAGGQGIVRESSSSGAGEPPSIQTSQKASDDAERFATKGKAISVTNSRLFSFSRAGNDHAGSAGRSTGVQPVRTSMASGDREADHTRRSLAPPVLRYVRRSEERDDKRRKGERENLKSMGNKTSASKGNEDEHEKGKITGMPVLPAFSLKPRTSNASDILPSTVDSNTEKRTPRPIESSDVGKHNALVTEEPQKPVNLSQDSSSRREQLVTNSNPPALVPEEAENEHGGTNWKRKDGDPGEEAQKGSAVTSQNSPKIKETMKTAVTRNKSPPLVGLDAMNLVGSRRPSVVRNGALRSPGMTIPEERAEGERSSVSSRSEASSSSEERNDDDMELSPVPEKAASGRVGSNSEDHGLELDYSEDHRSGASRSDSYGSPSAAPISSPRQLSPRHTNERPLQGKRPRSFVVGRGRNSAPVLKQSSPTAEAIVGKDGATFGEALAVLRERDNAPKRRGRPSNQVLRERRKVEILRHKLHQEIRVLRREGNAEENENCATSTGEPGRSALGKSLPGRKKARGGSRSEDSNAAGQDGFSFEGLEGLPNDSASDDDLMVDEDLFSGDDVQESGDSERPKRHSQRENTYGVEGGIHAKRPRGRPRKRSMKHPGVFKGIRRPSSQAIQKGKSMKEFQLNRKRKGMNSTGGKDEALAPVTKRRRGRPPGSTKQKMMEREALKLAEADQEKGKGKGLSPRTSLEHKDVTKRQPGNDDEQGWETVADAQTRNDASRMNLRNRPMSRVRSAKAQHSMEDKEQLISNLRDELDHAREKLEKESSRALELEEALGLDISMNTPSSAEYDKLAAKLMERERELNERTREVGERGEEMREKDAAMRGFMMQIKGLEVELAASKAVSERVGGMGGGASEEDMQAHLSRMAELEAEVEEKTERVQKLQKMVERHAAVLKNALRTNRKLQQKIYSLNSHRS